MASPVTNLLVVDDNPAMRRLLKGALSRDFQVNVLEAANGQSALATLDSDPVDVVVLDWSMPVMDGLETLKAIRRSSTHAKLPVVMLTASAHESNVQRAVEYEVCDFIVKPISLDNLRQRLAPILARVASGEHQQRSAPALDFRAIRRILLVDESSDYRRLFASYLNTLCEIEETDSGLAAARTCIENRPDAVFFGTTMTLMGDSLFAKTLAETPELNSMPVFRIVDADELERARSSNPRGGAIIRTTDNFTFLQQLKPLVPAETFARVLMTPDSSCVAKMFDTARRLLGEVLGSAISVQRPSDVNAGDITEWLSMASVLALGGGTWRVSIDAPRTFAVKLASAHLLTAPEQVSEEQILTTGRHVMGSVADALRGALAAHGADGDIQPTALELVASTPASLTSRETGQVGRWFTPPQMAPGALVKLVPVHEK